MVCPFTSAVTFSVAHPPQSCGDTNAVTIICSGLEGVNSATVPFDMILNPGLNWLSNVRSGSFVAVPCGGQFRATPGSLDPFTSENVMLSGSTGAGWPLLLSTN